jgi:hypothetical protein
VKGAVLSERVATAHWHCTVAIAVTHVALFLADSGAKFNKTKISGKSVFGVVCKTIASVQRLQSATVFPIFDSCGSHG